MKKILIVISRFNNTEPLLNSTIKVIKKNLNILCFNQNQKIGNGFVLPAGPLREGLGSIKDTQIIIINGSKDSEFEKLIYKHNKDVLIYYSK